MRDTEEHYANTFPGKWCSTQGSQSTEEGWTARCEVKVWGVNHAKKVGWRAFQPGKQQPPPPTTPYQYWIAGKTRRWNFWKTLWAIIVAGWSRGWSKMKLDAENRCVLLYINDASIQIILKYKPWEFLIPSCLLSYGYPLTLHLFMFLYF